ncbi:STM4015 family protein (plasmid) [Deinococcus taeanensis]|uniref:STM4015 family protein n=1 Tax=Deinococcus taeanensis TaxID=2737050 RepID=UPI001CDB75DC|nr:STM4015 family protein [Deinococcus taeanensis]UBV45241.1 STM4015 family protein [Deinococcus taeanensis]
MTDTPSYGDLSTFGGFEVMQWQPGEALGDPEHTIHRLSVEYDGTQEWAELLAQFLAQPGVEQIQGLVTGYWSTDVLMDEDPVASWIEPLRQAAPQLPNLRVLYVNDIGQEEHEVSWISNGDLSPLLMAFPKLTHLGIRGGNGLELPHLHLPHLDTLIIEAGGLSAELVRQVLTADLPALRHLELYLGTQDYGATSSADDLTPILDGRRFPQLKYLGLKNSDFQDQIAQLLVAAPVTQGLEVLDLSMGILTDEGGRALLDSPALGHLQKLDLQFNWMSEALRAQLTAWAERQDLELDVSDAQDTDDDEWRYVALGE